MGCHTQLVLIESSGVLTVTKLRITSDEKLGASRRLFESAIITPKKLSVSSQARYGS